MLHGVTATSRLTLNVERVNMARRLRASAHRRVPLQQGVTGVYGIRGMFRGFDHHHGAAESYTCNPLRPGACRRVTSSLRRHRQWNRGAKPLLNRWPGYCRPHTTTFRLFRRPGADVTLLPLSWSPKNNAEGFLRTSFTCLPTWRHRYHHRVEKGYPPSVLENRPVSGECFS